LCLWAKKQARFGDVVAPNKVLLVDYHIPGAKRGCYTYGMFWQYSHADTKTLLIATLLVFSGYALLLTQELFRDMGAQDQQAQTIGVYAQIEETPESVVAAELAEWESDLTVREVALARTMQANRSEDTRELLVMMVVGVGLLGLILLNFYLDAHRRVHVAPEPHRG